MALQQKIFDPGVGFLTDWPNQGHGIEVLVRVRLEVLHDALKTLLLSYTTTCNYCSFTVRSFPLLSPRRCRVIEASRVQYHNARVGRRLPLSARSVFSHDDAGGGGGGGGGGGESSSKRRKSQKPSPQPTTSKSAGAATAAEDAKAKANAKQVDQEVSAELFITAAYRRWLVEQDSAM